MAIRISLDTISWFSGISLGENPQARFIDAIAYLDHSATGDVLHCLEDAEVFEIVTVPGGPLPQNKKEEPKGDLKQCLLGVGGKLLEGALDPVSVLANGAASVAVSAGYDIAKYNASAGGIIAETGVKLAPSGGAISRWSIARASGALAGKLFVAGTVIVAVGYASYYAYNSQDCRPH